MAILFAIPILFYAFYISDLYFQKQPLSLRSALVYPNVAKVWAFQSRGGKGEAVAIYCDPLATKALERSGFPAG